MSGDRPRFSRERARATVAFFVAIVTAGYAATMVAMLAENYSPEKSLLFESLAAFRETGSRLSSEFGRDFVEPLSDRLYLARSDLPRINLQIAPQNLSRLRDKRDRAIAERVLIAEPGDSVPATIRLDGTTVVNVDVRLKGDNTDHLRGSIWSLRVSVRDGDRLFGMRRFSLQRPETRGGHAEALVLRQLRQEGILAPSYRFVDLMVNDRFLGVVALEEHFSKELLEAQGRRESVIVAFDEDTMWRQRRINRESRLSPVVDNPIDATPFDTVTMQPLRVFQESRVLSTPALREHYREAVGLARGYLDGRIDADQVFDMERVGRFMAILHSWCVYHGLIEHNLRLYYNPVTRLFEPIGFDNNVPEQCADDPSKTRFENPGLFAAHSSPTFLRSYAETVDRLDATLQNGELTGLLESWEDELLEHFALAGKDPARFPVQRLAERARYMKDHLPTLTADSRFHPHRPSPLVDEPRLSGFFTAYYVERNGRAELEVHNVTDRPIRIDAVVGRTERGRVPIALAADRRIAEPNRPLDEWLRIPVPTIDPTAGELYEITATFDARNKHTSAARASFHALSHAKYQPPSVSEFQQRFEFIRRSGERELTVVPGSWTVDASLITPRGYALHVSPGTTLRFCRDCRVVVRGPLSATGSAGEPILLSAIEKDEGWAGVVVLGANDGSRMEHVSVEGARRPPEDDWNLTGAVTFYESDVVIESCSFSDNRTEDALNIVRGDFAIVNSEFRSSASDAVDIDSGVGVISTSLFEGMGGDGIDASASEIRVVDCTIREAADQSISVDEATRLTGDRLMIDGANAASAARPQDVLVSQGR